MSALQSVASELKLSHACKTVDLLLSCMFSQAPREKDGLRPATLSGSAFSAFRKTFRPEPAKNAANEKIFRTFRKCAAGPWEAALSRALAGGCPERSLRDHKGDQNMQSQTSTQHPFFNTITQGNCIDVMRQMPANSVDFILTDPPYSSELPRPQRTHHSKTMRTQTG